MKRFRATAVRTSLGTMLFGGVLIATGTAQTTPANTPTSTAITSALRKDFYFYHGKDGSSSLVLRGSALPYYLADGKQLRAQLATGAQVCVTVLNAHPVNYTYALGVAIDTTQPALPALPAALTALASNFKSPPKVGVLWMLRYHESFRISADFIALISPLGDAVKLLGEEIKLVEKEAKDSDQLEPLSDVDATTSGQAGYRYAQDVIKEQD